MNRFFVSSSTAAEFSKTTSHFFNRTCFFTFSTSSSSPPSSLSPSLWKTRFCHAGIRPITLNFKLTSRFRVQCFAATTTTTAPARRRLSKKKVDPKLPPMEEERDAFYVVRKGDIVGVYKNFNDCQAQAGSSVCDPSVSVYKGYSLPKGAEEYLTSRGLKNATYTINAADAREDLFGSLVLCPFQQPASSKDKTSTKPSPPKRSQEVLESTSNLVKMDERERTDSISTENHFVGSDYFVNGGTGELTATPLKKYVTFLGSRKDGSACKWICNFGCKKEPYTGTYSRIRAHLIGLLPGQKAQGVALCSKVNKEEKEKMKIEEAEAKRVFGGANRIPVSVLPKSNTSMIMESQNIMCMSEGSSTNDVDAIIAKFFYADGIPFNVAKSPFWYDMVKAINEAPKGYKPPCAKKIKTNLLDNEKYNIDKTLLPLKEQWPIYGVSIVSYGWTNSKNQPLINVMAMSGGKSMFICSATCLDNERKREFISEILLKAIEYVGVYNVVQVLTDDASVCKSAGEMIEAIHPHILWSGCMAHTLSLLLKDIVNSKNSALDFASDVHERAKTIVNYIKNHSPSLYKFQIFSALDVFQVKKTRFGSYFVLLERVVRVKNALINMVLSEEWENFEKVGFENGEHQRVKRIILDDDFWHNAKFVLSFTKPVWEMICFCDSDKVVIGEIYQRMIDMLDNIKEALAERVEIQEVIENLIMARWEKMNRPLHCLAYVLNPYYYSRSWFKGGERRKPHADPYVDKVYLDVVERLVRDPMERGVIRQQLSEFVSNKGVFARHQAIEDRETMSAITWWDIYGVTTNELYNLAIKVLSQGVNTSCGGREWSTYGYIHSVKRNKMNVDRAERLVYVHYNHRLLSRYRSDYEEAYKNWDVYANDDNLDNDIEAIEDGEYLSLHDAHISSLVTSSFSSQDQIHESSSYTQGQRRQEILLGKRPRLE